MPCRRLALSLLLLFTATASAQIRSGFPKPEAAQNIVREFCRLDFLGGRLSADGWTRMKPLTTWKDNPGWHSFRIASRYELTAQSTGYRSARVTVQYQSLGAFELGLGFTPLAESETVEFKLKDTDDGLRIESTEPDLGPHISKARAIQWLEGKLKTVTDPADKSSIETALKQLQPPK